MAVVIAVGKIILTVYSAVSVALEYLMVEVVAGVVSMVAAVAHQLANTVIALIQTASSIMFSTLSGIVTTVAQITVKAGQAFTDMVEYVNRVWNGLKKGYDALLVAIHFETLKKVHNISLMISKDYRKVYREFWDKVKDLSTALKMADVGLPLLLRISQQSQQMFSSMIGVGNDISNLHWMRDLSKWDGWKAIAKGPTNISLGRLMEWLDSSGETDMYTKESDPEPPGFHFILNQFKLGMSEPIFDGAANISKVNYAVTEGIIETTDGLINQYMALDQSISQLQKAIPQDWSDVIERATGSLRKHVNNFIEDVYMPTMVTMNRTIQYLKDNMTAMEERTDLIAGKIVKPGEMLQDIDKLSDIERKIEEDKISQAASRSEMREAEPINREIDKDLAHVSQAFDEDILTTAPPKFLGLEKEGVKPKQPGEVKPGEGWYVGDF